MCPPSTDRSAWCSRAITCSRICRHGRTRRSVHHCLHGERGVRTPMTCSIVWVCSGARTRSLTRSAAVSSSEWPSHAPWRAGRACCCSTSRFGASMTHRPPSRSTRSASQRATSRHRFSWSPTTRRTRQASSQHDRHCNTDRSEQMNERTMTKAQRTPLCPTPIRRRICIPASHGSCRG